MGLLDGFLSWIGGEDEKKKKAPIQVHKAPQPQQAPVTVNRAPTSTNSPKMFGGVPQFTVPRPTLLQPKPVVQAPKQNDLDVGKVIDGIVKSAQSTGQKTLNTLGAGAVGLETLAQGAADAVTGNKDINKNAKANQDRMFEYLNRKTVTGDNGAWISPEQAQNKNKDIVGNFIKPIVSTAAEVTPYIAPAGGFAKGAGLLPTVGKTAALNAVVSGGTDAASQLANKGSIDPMQTLQSAALGGVIGGAAPVVGAGFKGTVNRTKDIQTQPGYNGQAGYIKPIPGQTLLIPDTASAKLNAVPEATPQAFDQVDKPILKSQPELLRRKPNSELPLKGLVENTVQDVDNLAPSRASDIQPLKSHTSYDNTLVFDTKQYVSEMNKAQKIAGEGGSKFKKSASELKATMIDDLAPIEDRLNKAIKEGADIDPRDHITYQLDRSRRAEGINNAYMNDKGLTKIIQNVKNPKEFDQYLIARHAKELDESITTGRDAAKDAQLVTALDGKYKAAAEELYAYNRSLLDSSVEYGLISKETAAALKKQYPDYVPFNRIFKEDELVGLHGNAKADASISKQTAIQKLEGSKRTIASPLNSIIDKTRVVIEQGERNKTANMLISYKDLPGNPFGLKPIRTAENVKTRIDLYEQAKELKPAQEQLRKIAKKHAGWTRKLELEIDRLNKKGLYLSLKPKDIKDVPIKGKAFAYKNVQEIQNAQSVGDRSKRNIGAAREITGNLSERLTTSRGASARETRQLVNSLINAPVSELERLKATISKKDKKLADVIDELQSVREILEGVKNTREVLRLEALGYKDGQISNKPTIASLKNGIKEIYEVDEEIAEAAKHMSREQIGLIGRVVAMPARILRAGATGVNVGFAGANIVKDVIGAAINSPHPMRIADPRNFGKALSAALHHNGKNYQELMREGVAGTSFDMYRNPLKSNVGELRSQKNLLTRTVRNIQPQNWYRTLENTISRSEDFGRALQYYSNKSGYKAAGESDDVARILAGDQARNNSTNFFRSGSAGKHINLAVPYWNAGVQGSRIQIRRIKERPAQTIGKIAAVIALPSALVARNNYGDEKKRAVIDQIPEYEKKGNIIIIGDNPVYNEETRVWDDVYKFPVPPQHTGIHNAIQQAVASFYTGEDYDVVGALGGVAENYATIDPTDTRAVANKLTPQALKLVAEPMTNTNFYTGNKIIPDSQKNLPAADQSGQGTSGTAKVIGGLTNISPRVLDNTVRTAFGGAGQNLIERTDTMLADAGVVGKDEVRGETALDSIKGRFYGPSKTPTSDRIEKQFAGLKKEVLNSDAYKQASTYDKQRMLNRLESDISAVEYNTDGYGSGKLTKKQKELSEGGFKLETYTNLDDNSKEPTKTYAEKYADAQKAFNEDSADWSPIERRKKENELADLAVQKDFDNDTVSLYGMSKDDVYNFVSKDDKGQEYVDKILKYGDAMVAAGLYKTNKFRDKYGNLSLSAPKAKGASTGRGKGRKKKGISPSDFKLPTTFKKYRTKGAELARNAKLSKTRTI